MVQTTPATFVFAAMMTSIGNQKRSGQGRKIMTKKGYQPSYKPQDRAYYSRARKTIKENEIELECIICGSDRLIEIHHVNRDITDNCIENLEPLCKNCHIFEHERR